MEIRSLGMVLIVSFVALMFGLVFYSSALFQRELPFQNPIEFWGRLVDVAGEPIPDARVYYRASDKFMAPGSSYTGISDEEGRFHIDSIRAVSLNVSVSKEGYHRIPGRSVVTFGYNLRGGNEAKPPTKAEPAVLVLRRQGELEPLNVHESGSIRIPKDGEPLSIDLATGEYHQGDRGDIVLRGWIDEERLGNKRNYRWRYALEVPGGGVQMKPGDDRFGFEAPREGYAPEFTYEMPAEPEDGRWKSEHRPTVFVRLADGTYARVELKVLIGNNNFFIFKSHHNPGGSRNLETRAR